MVVFVVKRYASTRGQKMAVRSTQCQNRAVRSTQGGRGVSPSNIMYTYLRHADPRSPGKRVYDFRKLNHRFVIIKHRSTNVIFNANKVIAVRSGKYLPKYE